MALPSVKSDWATVLTEYAAGHRQEVVPAGWLTKNEIAHLWDKSKTYTNKLLSILIKNGKAETRSYIIRVPHVHPDGKKSLGHCRKVPHYRLLTSGKGGQHCARER